MRRRKFQKRLGRQRKSEDGKAIGGLVTEEEEGEVTEVEYEEPTLAIDKVEGRLDETATLATEEEEVTKEEEGWGTHVGTEKGGRGEEGGRTHDGTDKVEGGSGESARKVGDKMDGLLAPEATVGATEAVTTLGMMEEGEVMGSNSRKVFTNDVGNEELYEEVTPLYENESFLESTKL